MRAVDIPIIDIGGQRHLETSPGPVGEQIKVACLDSGFFYLLNHGLDEDLLAAVFDANRRFHSLPLAEKENIKLNHWHRGYQGYATSKLVSSARFAAAAAANQLESFFLRHEVPADDPGFKREPLKGPNQWPADPEFRDVVSRYDTAVRGLATKLLPAFAYAVGEAPDFFDAYFQTPSTALRLIHYPGRDSDADAFGIHPHTDYGFMTILAQDQTGGLEIQRPDGTWLLAPPLPGTLIVNIGDALARWTNDAFNSTPHRVNSPPDGESRYSVAMFFDPDVDAQICTLNRFSDADNPPRHAPIRYGDYFQERLDSNYPERTAAAVT